MYTILEMKGYEPKKIWEKDDTIYNEALYMRWNMKFMVINLSGIRLLSDREFNDYIHEGKYLYNKERYSIAERMEDKYILKCLKLVNEANIEYKKNNEKNFTSDIVIQEMLKDEEIFYKISKEKAYKLLNVLEINNVDEVYKKLIIK